MSQCSTPGHFSQGLLFHLVYVTSLLYAYLLQGVTLTANLLFPIFLGISNWEQITNCDYRSSTLMMRLLKKGYGYIGLANCNIVKLFSEY